MLEKAIEIQGLSKSYEKTQVIENFSLNIEWGSIYGLLGRNGAGKTTMIRMLTGLISKNSGEIKVSGRDPYALDPVFWEQVSYVSEHSGFPPTYTVEGLLKITRSFYNHWDEQMVEHLLEAFHVPKKKLIFGLSKGVQRALAFILAMAHQPQILILDEPSANLDVVARRIMLDALLEFIRSGEKRAVLFSTHILSDLERVADHLGIITNGRLVVDQPLDELKESSGQNLEDLFLEMTKKRSEK
ncbi:MAG: ABC transporter ATP-binding protein [Verrucomicrobiota bacterium]